MKFSKIHKLFLGFIFLALAGFGCNQSPQAVIKSMKKNLLSVGGLSFALSFEGQNVGFLDNATVAPLGSDRISFDFSGKTAQAEKGLFDVKATFEQSSATGQGDSAGELIYASGELYLMLTSVDFGNLAGEEAGALDFSAFLDQWFIFSDPLGGLEVLVQEDGLTNAQKRKLFSLVKKTRFLSPVDESTEGESINGQEVYKYQVSFNVDNVLDFFEKASEITQSDFSDEDRQDLEKNLNSFNQFTNYLWIGKKDRLPYKIELQSEDFILNVTFSDFNEGVEIEAPEGAITFESLTLPGDDAMGGGALPEGVAPYPENLQPFQNPEDFTLEDFEELQKMFEGAPSDL